ncbi:MAG: hypothetical protein MJ076_01215 [Clostridia bacterium]|nr:hypothetical protein [Clostridia bacterium]
MNILVILLAGVIAFLIGIIAGLTDKKGRKSFVPERGVGLNSMSKEYHNFLNYDGTEQA